MKFIYLTLYLSIYSIFFQGHHKNMINKVRDFQHNGISDLTAKSREGLLLIDESLSHMLMVLKRNMAQDTEAINTYRQLVELVKVIRERKNVEIASLDQYIKFHKQLDKTLAVLEEKVCHPLAQVRV